MIINTIRGEITADEIMLNYILLLAKEAAKGYDRDGHHARAKRAEDFARSIYRELEKAGMYKDF